MTRNIRSFIRGEKRHRIRHILRSTHAPKRDQFHRLLLEIFRQRGRHRSFDESRSYGVTGYVSRSNFAGNCHGKADESCFGRGIVCLAGLADLTKNGCNVDNSSPALAKHRTDDLLSAQICRSQIGIDDRIPVGAFHAHDELVAGDSSIVDQDIDLAEFSDDCFACVLDLLFIGNVHRECSRLAASAADVTHQFFQLFLIPRDHGYSRATLRQFENAGLANSLRRAGDQRYTS